VGGARQKKSGWLYVRPREYRPRAEKNLRIEKKKKPNEEKKATGVCENPRKIRERGLKATWAMERRTSDKQGQKKKTWVTPGDLNPV